MPESRRERIATIIQQRKPFLQAIESIQARLQQRIDALVKLEQTQALLLQHNLAPGIQGRLRQLPIAPLRQEMEKTKRELELPKKRFSRPTINIGVVGRAGQGKSSLLQSLSDLDQEIIPSGRGGHCTGVRSIILHAPEQPPHGEITFYAKQALLDEVITPYYQKLPQLGPAPASIDTFINSNLPRDLGNGSSGDTVKGEMLRHLQTYKNHAEAYYPLLGQGTVSVDTRTIREYVAQDDVQGKAAYHKHLAVREAQIICTFKHPDVGQIALIDMPGLGDTGVGDEERLVRALGEHIDIVLYVFMPGSHRAALQDVDFQLYDLIYRSLDGIPIERWAFMVLNHTRDNDNANNCQRIQQQVLSEQTGSGQNRLKFVDCLIADCHDQDEAKTVVLDRVLNHLASHMHELDETYVSVWDQRLAALEQAMQALLGQAQQIISGETENASKITYAGRLFEEELWPEFERTLLDLRREIERESTIESPVLKNYFQEKLTLCQSDIMLPQLEEIERHLRNFDAPYGAMNLLINETRTKLTRQFAQIDVQLQLDEIKRRVAETFKQAGKLAHLAENTSGKDFFWTVARKMPASMQIQQEAFQAFATYELSLQGLFQNLIRKNLHFLDPNRPEPYQFIEAQNIHSAQQLLTALKTARDETIIQWRNVLAGWLMLPTEATYAIVSELIDQTLYSERAEARWKEFYLIHYQYIWPAQFAESANRERLFQQWQTSVEHARRVYAAEPVRLLPLLRQTAHS
jgi:predicted GTPase